MKRRARALLCLLTGLVAVLGPVSAARADQWQDRVWAGSGYAAGAGSTVEIAMLDRRTGLYRDNGAAAHTRIESASVMKLFIAENLLHRRDLGQIRLSATDMADMSRMLRESYDAAANRFWSGYGTNAIVSDVIGRYGLTETGLTSNVRYWGNTLITAHDMVVFYQRLMDGSGGLSASSRTWIVDQLRQSTEQGDGGRQFFGLHDGLPLEQVIAQKQGWICCVNGNAYRHSTGLVGPDSRYVLVALSRPPGRRW
ncbi:serine hydrolase [Modestobacter excelsi]|uniref:serine hydrolase n=1 Tax=Modestobacter excelsi TaxID=2213161 RepID=UPI00110CBB68|nr:serine hydrolase [Modestobacter excelsi]